jgi:hypothetical protein
LRASADYGGVIVFEFETEPKRRLGDGHGGLGTVMKC